MSSRFFVFSRVTEPVNRSVPDSASTMAFENALERAVQAHVQRLDLSLAGLYFL